MDWCAKCDKPLERLEHGAYRECCDGSYWSTLPSYPNDPAYRFGGVIRTKVYYYFRLASHIAL